MACATVVFDLDDTLYKEHDFVVSGKHAVATDFAKLTGMHADEALEIALAHPDSYEALRKLAESRGIEYPLHQFLSTYRNHKPMLKLQPEVETTLKHLADAGCTLALITDGRSITQRNKITALGLDRFFRPELIVVSEEIGAEKTEAKPFELITHRIGMAKGGRRFYIGDNPRKDFLHPNLRGWTSVMLRDTRGENVHVQNPEMYPPQNRPLITIDRFETIKDICHSN